MLKKILSENLKKFVFKYTNIGKPKYQYNIDPLQLTEIIISLEKVKEVIQRHNFMIPVQAASGGKIVARESIKGFKKDVLTKIQGGGATDRKRKLLEKQKKGKARSKQFGKVEIPQEAFIGVLKINKDA